MQTETSDNRGLFSIFKDNFDLFLQSAITDRYSEGATEQSEGVTEFANPQTVSQPTRQSQLPSGESLNRVANRLGVSNTVLIAGGGALAVVVLLKLFKVF